MENIKSMIISFTGHQEDMFIYSSKNKNKNDLTLKNHSNTTNSH